MELSKALEFYSLENALFYQREKVAVFIDGSNFYATVRALEFAVDYKKLYELFRESCHLVRISYYTAVHTDHETNMIKMKPMLDYMEYNGWLLVTKPTKEINRGPDTAPLIKGDMDVEIVVDALKIAKHVDHIVLFSGDSDFVALIKALDDMGKRVTIVSSFQTKYCADETRKAATHYVELSSLVEKIKNSSREERA